MNKKNIIWIFVFLILVSNVSASDYVETHTASFTSQGTASEGEGIGIKVFTNFTLLSMNKSNVNDNSSFWYIQNAARTTNLSSGRFNATNSSNIGIMANVNYAFTNTNGSSGTQYFIVTNSLGSTRTTWGQNPGVTYPIATSSGLFNFSNAVLNDGVNTASAFGIKVLTITDTPGTTSRVDIDFITPPTPSNNTINFYTNSTLTIQTNSTIGNTTIYLYDSSFTLLDYTSNNGTSNYTTLNKTLTNIGIYYFNATWSNGTVSNVTQLRVFTLYNLTKANITLPLNFANVSRSLNVNWTNASTNTTISISNYTIIIYNNDSLTVNRTLGTVSNLSFWGYDTFTNSLTRGSYYVGVLAIDTNNNSILSNKNFFNITIDAELNITVWGYNSTQQLTFNISFDGMSYNTSNGKITLGIVKNSNYSIVIDAVTYALNVSNYSANSSSFQFINYSLQANQSMNITIYNIATGLPITTQNFTIIITTTTFRNYTATNGKLYITDLDEGSNEIRAFNTLFAETVLTKTVNSRSTQSVNIYLSATNTSNNVTLIYQDVNGVPILNMYVTQSVLFNSSYTLMMDGYTDINGKVYFVYDPLYYYLYNNSLTGYSPVPFYLTPPRELSYTITVPFSSTYATYNTINVTGISSYNNATNIIQFNYTSRDATITNYSYTISKILNSQPVIICSDTSTTYPTNSFNCNVQGYTGIVYVQGVANGNRIYYGEWIDLKGKTKLFDNINSKNSNYLAGILMIIIVFMGLTFGVWATLIMGLIGILFIYFIGLSSAITISIIGITILVTIVIALKLKR